MLPPLLKRHLQESEKGMEGEGDGRGGEGREKGREEFSSRGQGGTFTRLTRPGMPLTPARGRRSAGALTPHARRLATLKNHFRILKSDIRRIGCGVEW